MIFNLTAFGRFTAQFMHYSLFLKKFPEDILIDRIQGAGSIAMETFSPLLHFLLH